MKTGNRGADLAVPAWGASSAGAQLALQGFGQLAIVDYESDRVLGATGDSYGHSLQVFRPGQRVQDSFSSSLQDMVLDSGQHLDPLPLFLGRFTATTGDLLTLIAQAPEAAGPVVLEAMPAAEPPQTAESVLARLRRSSSRIAAAPDRKTLLAQAAEEMQLLSGFDRVLIHRLDADGSEAIVGEARNEQLPSMLNHASTTTPLAELATNLKTRGLRFIPDTDYKPQALLGPSLGPEELPDLDHCLLQGIPAFCSKALSQAGVRAFLSLSLVVGDELWGLITCHNATAVRPDYTLIEKCQYLTESLAQEIGKRQQQKLGALRSRIESSGREMLLRLVTGDRPDERLLEAGPQLLDILPADGVAILCGNQIAAHGTTPARSELRRLGSCLNRMLTPLDGLFVTDCLSSYFPNAASFADKASGLLAIRISSAPDIMILWFRKEERGGLVWMEPRRDACSFIGLAASMASPAPPDDGVPPDDRPSMRRGRSRPWHDLIIELIKPWRERASYIFQQVHIEALNRQLRAANRELSQLAETDALTGLANRRIFDERLALEWERAQRDGRSLSLILIDVDFFKRYNDSYGHPAGDACLVDIAGVLRAAARRATDLVARLGGEEFAMLLPATGRDGAQMLAEKLRQDVLALDIAHREAPGGVVSISLGVATTRPQCSPAETRSHLIKTADVALYKAKGSGRNRVCVQEL